MTNAEVKLTGYAFTRFLRVTYMFSNSTIVAFLLMRVQRNNLVTKVFTIAHQSERLISASNMYNVYGNAKKFVVIQKPYHLRESVYIFIHKQLKLMLQNYNFKLLFREISCNKL